LDMEGCRMDRLNAGAPVFDSHMDGLGFRSLMANVNGTKAQVGVVLKAWADGNKGMATLKFYGGAGMPEDDECDQLWGKIQSGIIQNLSFGTWIYKKEAEKPPGEGTESAKLSADDPDIYVATDWEPFEISPVTVPADFSTEFLSAEQTGA